MMDQEQVNTWMQHAIRLGKQGVGRTAENPSVGCLILSADGKLIGAGRTSDGGRPHAEINALALAVASSGNAARGGTAFVTLEPCSHTGKSGPCAEALIQSGIKTVYLGLVDPDPRVSGRGIAKLQAAGISVHKNICAGDCDASLRGFLSRIRKRRPFVTLKMATTLDGKTALANGQSKWITGDVSRQIVHLQRAASNAIIIGGATVLADNPKLTVRLGGLEAFSPIPVILDTNVSINPMDVVSQYPTAIHLTKHNTNVKDGHLDLSEVLQHLATLGINDAYVESGGALATSFLQEKLVDELIWFRAPKIFGADGRNAICEMEMNLVSNAPTFTKLLSQSIGNDIMEIYRPCSLGL